MRSMDNQLTFDFENSFLKSSLTIVQQVIEKYKSIDRILNENSEIIQFVHNDLRALSTRTDKAEKRGRQEVYSTQTLFRALIVKKVENYTFKNLTFQLAQSGIFHQFCSLGNRESITPALMCRVEKAITPQTWEKINHILISYSIDNLDVDGNEARMDATVVENEVHYPTDSSLLWDSYRTLARCMHRILGFFSSLPKMRFHKDKTKKLHLDITRFSKSTRKERKKFCKQNTKKLCSIVERTCDKALPIVQQAQRLWLKSQQIVPQKVQSSIKWLLDKIPVMKQIVSAGFRRLHGENVPLSEKIFSLFEDHAEMIIRGRAGILFEIGHKIFLSQSRSKIILDYNVLSKCKPDTELLGDMIERHEERFGEGSLQIVHADKGCRNKEDEMKKLSRQVTYICVPSRLRDLSEPGLAESQKFRAGIEGSISCLKRHFGLSRTRKRSFKSFCSDIGLSIFCHNLRIMAEMLCKT